MNLFQTQEYLEVFKRHFCREKDVVDGIWEKSGEKLILLGMKPVLGKEEVTDYAKTDIKELPQGYKKIQLDYVREDSETYSAFAKSYGETKQEVAPYIDLPKTWEEYLDGLKRKYRKEIKRKIKRLESAGYEIIQENNVEEFIRLHRLSDPEKKKFMSQSMAEFFKDLLKIKIPGWQTKMNFLRIGDKNAASIVTFENASEVWLYNSGFDPEFSFYSVGVVLKVLNIKKAIEDGKKKYDFLRGNERYKYELGGKDLQLYKLYNY
ncbi:MAG: GNAT family N-acetyltransferase [Patescibacteria group bacterium]|nr:GNAT family N-acetyltransferase [Patescibacteria group bacterium]